MADTFNPFETPEDKEPMHEDWAAKRRVADATRRLIHNLVTSTDTASDLYKIADAIDQQADALARSPSLYGLTAFERADEGKHGTRFHLGYEMNPVFGKCNPVAPPFNIWIDDDSKRVYGQVRMDWQYEGPPNSVHGGFVAALFDQFLGIGQKLTGQPGFTGTLSVRYIKPTPIDTDLRLEGWVDRIEGRKNYMVSEMWAGDTLTARCEGIFISVSAEVVGDLQNRYSSKK